MTRSVVVMLPGLLCDEAVWACQREALADVECIVPSFGALASIEAMASHVLATVPDTRFSLVGHSMGGRVALDMVRQAPQRIARLALLDSGVDPLAEGAAGAEERRQRMALLALARSAGMRTMGRQWAAGMVHPAHCNTPIFEAILDMIERKSPAIFEAQLQALLERPDARPVLAALRCPTLLLCGRQDGWSPLARHRQMHALLPDSRLVVVEDAGHMTTMEQPQAVSAALIEWLGMPDAGH
ncbi:alpha/beta fold hydrolase [Denitromonas iodatirespirans]|uniref:Alpha/beta hydrolase n=1 Tax=Denitromonas iodatirespirans TaxID=2795389 RepID=A0A944DQU6_DENI1|nr:alpha/beta hydrolase [Denitromonas iodatirespirans]MBT0962929.1 alpha/beta hydrolase [Denitromonas iodatirespirans]